MLRQRFFFVVSVLSSVAVLSACQIERLFPEEVGGGAARLTVRNAAVLAKALDDDTNCGFSSDAVKNGYVVDGEVGHTGSVTWHVDGCVIDFGVPHVVASDCNGVERTVGGRAVISGSRTVRGVLTGDADKPVVPLANDAARMRYSADVTDFVVRLSDSGDAATIRAGRLAFDAAIHLAQSASLGVCAIDTAEVTIDGLTMAGGAYTIESDGRTFDVDVPTLAVSAQLGAWGDRENDIEGTITVWEDEVDVGADDSVLDPGYDRETFQDSYACKADLKLPQSYECPDLASTLANGAARLALNDVGNLVQAAVADTRCGFASAAVMHNARTTGAVGRPGGEVVFTIDEPCTIELPDDTELGRDCNGTTTLGSGRATIRGSMRQRGRLTGDALQPVVPESRDAVEIVFDVDFHGLKIAVVADGKEKAKVPAFQATSGGATGRMRPRLAKDTTTGACSVPTPVVAFDDVVLKPGTAGLLHNDGLAMAVTFREGQLRASAGDHDDEENVLDGSVVVDAVGAAGVAVDVSGDLDPAYDPDAALAGYTCGGNVAVPASDDECDFAPVLAENAARLVIQTAGTLATMINKDDQCGFEDQLGVLLWPTEVQGQNGEMGSMTWDVAGCSIANAPSTTMSVDCNGAATYVQGGADFVDVGRTVRGERDKMLLDLVIDSIIPRDPQSVDVFLRQVGLLEFSTWLVPAGADEPEGILVIHDGVLSATVRPALGARADDPATVDIPTPVARLESVRLSGNATLHAQGKTFHFRLDDTDLTATNGRFLGDENTLAGTVVLDGETHAISAVALNPTYAPTAFEASYVCTDNLAGPVR